jgi:hypothetical protein
MVAHDDVWEKVKQLRKQRREQLRRENGIGTRCLRWMLGGHEEKDEPITTEDLPTETTTPNDVVTPASETESDAGSDATTVLSERPHAPLVAEDSIVQERESTTTSTTTSDVEAQETSEHDDDSSGPCLQDAVETSTDLPGESSAPLQELEDSGTELAVSDAGEQECPDKPSCLQDTVVEEDLLEDDMESSTSTMHV